MATWTDTTKNNISMTNLAKNSVTMTDMSKSIDPNGTWDSSVYAWDMGTWDGTSSFMNLEKN